MYLKAGLLNDCQMLLPFMKAESMPHPLSSGDSVMITIKITEEQADLINKTFHRGFQRIRGAKKMEIITKICREKIQILADRRNQQAPARTEHSDLTETVP